jgi:hypothetical protein
MQRRTLLAAAALLPAIALAQTPPDWPTRPVRMLVGSAPGGGTDAMARAVADRLAPLLRDHAAQLLAQTEAATDFKAALSASMDKAAALALRAAEEGGDRLARAAASGLYHCFTATAMAWEASRTRSAERMRWAQLVLLHRVLPRDPLSAGDLPPADWTA